MLEDAEVLVTYLKAGVEAMTMGVFERGKGAAFSLGIKADRMVEYWVYNRARSGKSPASNKDLDGMMAHWKNRNERSTEE